MDLSEHASASLRRLIEQLEVGSPEVRRTLAAEHAPGNGHAGVDCEVAQPFLIVPDALGVLSGVFTGDLEDSGSQLPQHAHELVYLVPARDPARDGATVGSLVIARTRSREAHRTGANRVAQLALHRFQVVGRGLLLECALSHRERAQRRVTDVAAVVDALGQTLDGVEVLGEGRPGPVDALFHGLGRDVFGALQVAHDEVLVLRRSRGQREPAVAHHHGGDAVPARAGSERIPGDLRVHVGVPVDEARGDDLPLGIDLFTGARPNAADAGDAALQDPHIGAVTSKARSVDDGAVLDHEVVLHGSTPLART